MLSSQTRSTHTHTRCGDSCIDRGTMEGVGKVSRWEEREICCVNYSEELTFYLMLKQSSHLGKEELQGGDTLRHIGDAIWKSVTRSSSLWLAY